MHASTVLKVDHGTVKQRFRLLPQAQKRFGTTVETRGDQLAAGKQQL